MPDPDSVNPCSLLRRKLPPLFCAHGMLDPVEATATEQAEAE